jgi:hypothetical protein
MRVVLEMRMVVAYSKHSVELLLFKYEDLCYLP